MKKSLAFILTIVMAISMITTGVIPASAAENTMQPRLSNADTANVSFIVDDSGVGHFAVSYNGNEETFTEAKVSVTIQKRFLLVFWDDVDRWTGISNEVYGDLYTTFILISKGTYRAVFTLEFYGTSGVVDFIQDSIEFKHE